MGDDKFQRQVEFLFFSEWRLFVLWLSCLSSWVGVERGCMCLALNIYLESFCLQGAAKPGRFLAAQWRMRGDKFQGQLRFFFPCFEFVLWFTSSQELKEKLFFQTFFLLVIRGLQHFFSLSVCVIHYLTSDLTQLNNRVVACAVWRPVCSGGRSHIQSAVGSFLPVGEVIILPHCICDIATPGSTFLPSCCTTFIS